MPRCHAEVAAGALASVAPERVFGEAWAVSKTRHMRALGPRAAHHASESRLANLFTPGDLVVSVYGDGDGSGTYADNQAGPIVLQDYSTSGVAGGSLVLPQTTTTVNGVTQNAISGEYGSSSEGTLELSADGRSLTIAGYGVNAKTYNAAEATGGSNIYGNAALAQSTSLTNQTTYTPVARVVADVGANGTVDTSTALFNIYNTNNPRSVATTDGTSFYLGGQGVKGDTTQGVFLAQDGATSATAINTSDDVRTVELSNGQLYVSQDSKQPSSGGTSNISSVGTGQPTASATETVLPGISQSVALSGGNGNNVNMSTGTVNLSPENFYFANSTTLYVADGGAPKQGGAGDGGLQKWSLVNNTWKLDYTLSSGLALQQANANATAATASYSTGLIGLTGQVNANGTVSLYATTEPDFDTNSTSLVGITDTLANTTAAQSSGESFTTLATAAPDTVIRGVAFAPVCFAQGTRIRTTRGAIAVEALAIGDVVLTAAGDERAIRWLGHREMDCRRHPHAAEAWPVRIAAHAFGEGRPVRDLVLSPGHSVCVDMLGEVLIPVSSLINGSTIVQEEVDSVTYWHVELDAHEVILAEDLPTESYLDMGNRGFFAGEAGVTALHPSPDAVAADHGAFCRPFHAAGELVVLVRQRLAARAPGLGWTLRDDPLADLHLVVDGRRLEPQVSGLSARFLVPADAQAVWLVSNTGVPARVHGATDERVLGVGLAALSIQDGFAEPRLIAADDARLRVGFHHAESDTLRWTAGRAHLPTELWENCRGDFFLRVDLAMPALPRWERSAEIAAVASAA